MVVLLSHATPFSASFLLVCGNPHPANDNDNDDGARSRAARVQGIPGRCTTMLLLLLPLLLAVVSLPYHLGANTPLGCANLKKSRDFPTKIILQTRVCTDLLSAL